jgi:outer membrane lipoprotein carrier protein
VCTLGAGLPCARADQALDSVLRSVEQRYNRVKTLEVSFVENYTGQGRSRKGETGRLYLKKPGRMRWDYTNPAGKMLLSDGKDMYFYAPSTNRVEKENMKQSEDMRAPLAFLLGKLDFSREFQGFQMKVDGDARILTAEPKSDRLPYRQVTFTVGPEARIRRMLIIGQDESRLEFGFDQEVLNPKLDDKLFRFQMPAGADFIDTSKEQPQPQTGR